MRYCRKEYSIIKTSSSKHAFPRSSLEKRMWKENVSARIRMWYQELELVVEVPRMIKSGEESEKIVNFQ